MTVQDVYASIPELKAWLSIASTVTDRDLLLGYALATARADVDAHCGRTFGLDDAVSTRTYRPNERIAYHPDGEVLLVDDIGTATGLIVETGVTTFVAVTGTIEPQPENAIVRGRPISSLLLSGQVWPMDPYTRVRVTARWGWPVIPARVTEATLIQAARLYRRKESPDGTLGNNEFGTVRVTTRMDPDVEALLAHLVMPGFG